MLFGLRLNMFVQRFIHFYNILYGRKLSFYIFIFLPLCMLLIIIGHLNMSAFVILFLKCVFMYTYIFRVYIYVTICVILKHYVIIFFNVILVSFIVHKSFFRIFISVRILKLSHDIEFVLRIHLNKTVLYLHTCERVFDFYTFLLTYFLFTL